VFYSPNYSSQLPLWLTNSYHDMAMSDGEAAAVAVSTMTFGPVTQASVSAVENNNE
jgi:hypothetical protein